MCFIILPYITVAISTPPMAVESSASPATMTVPISIGLAGVLGHDVLIKYYYATEHLIKINI